MQEMRPKYCISKTTISMETDDEKGQYNWSYRRSGGINCGPPLASVVARKKCGAIRGSRGCPSRAATNCDECGRCSPKGSPKSISPRVLLLKTAARPLLTRRSLT